MRTIISLILPLLFIFSTMAVAQDTELEVFGYYEPQLMSAHLQGNTYTMSSNKLRVDLQLRTSDRVMFGANFDYITYHGKTNWDITEYLPESIQNEIPSMQFLGYEFNPYQLEFKDESFLDNAFVKLTFPRFDLTIGKQQLSMGTGYAWNPTDVFNQKDLIDPTYEQPGHNAIRLDVPLGGRVNMTAIYATGEEWKDSDMLLKIKTNISRFDLSALVIQKNWIYSDPRAIDPIRMDLYGLKTQRQIVGGDLVGELLGFGIWSEFAYNYVDIDDDSKKAYLEQLDFLQLSDQINPIEIDENFYEFLAGMDYTFDFQTYILCEYYRNSAGAADYKQYSFVDWMHYFLAERRSIARDQIYGYINHPLTDLIDVGGSVIMSLNDESVAIVPMINYNIFENVDLSLWGNIYLGSEGKIYASEQGNGGMLRARVYF